MMNNTNTHTNTIEICRRRAAAQLHMAEFIASRCASFDFVCPHDIMFNGLPSLHVYDGAEANFQFAADGWEPSDYDPDRSVQKIVQGVLVSAALVPQTPYVPAVNTYLP